MSDLVEYFKIPAGENACITMNEGKFKPWVAGCGISPSKDTLDEARKVIFDYTVDQLIRKRNRCMDRINRIEETLTKLGSDTFNLGQFKTKKD